MIVYTSKREVLQLAEPPFASGGEGAIYKVVSSPAYLQDVCVKLYHPHILDKEREDRVKDYVRGAVAAEKKGRVDNALRYYYWAYNLLSSLQTPAKVKYKHDDKELFLLNWIPEMMRGILDKLKMSVASYDKESGEVELLATYDGKPVTSLDFCYFDGAQWSSPTAAKDGMAQIELRPGTPMSNIQIRYEYAYKKQARQDTELEMVMNIFDGFPHSG